MKGLTRNLRSLVLVLMGVKVVLWGLRECPAALYYTSGWLVVLLGMQWAWGDRYPEAWQFIQRCLVTSFFFLLGYLLLTGETS